MPLHISVLKPDIYPYGQTFFLLQKKPNDSTNDVSGHIKTTKHESNKDSTNITENSSKNGNENVVVINDCHTTT